MNTDWIRYPEEGRVGLLREEDGAPAGLIMTVGTDVMRLKLDLTQLESFSKGILCALSDWRKAHAS